MLWFYILALPFSSAFAFGGRWAVACIMSNKMSKTHSISIHLDAVFMPAKFEQFQRDRLL